ncbi:hypothetical protein NQ318_008193 [Aromia moschata]|uniref:Nucleolar protein 58/56 N-terminal domain-containing protein n=1 Tax=Aromia moschata TaxID=1265417 RepID=A0AAV8YK51_9CUCU|nr:hypothetical protein NQ318_008193 [Aromia moschata]
MKLAMPMHGYAFRFNVAHAHYEKLATGTYGGPDACFPPYLWRLPFYYLDVLWFDLLDEKKLKEADNLYQAFETPEAAGRIIKLKHFEKFADTTEALAATTAVVEGKISKTLKKVLKNS